MKTKKPTNFLEVLIAERKERKAKQEQNREVEPITPVRTKVKILRQHSIYTGSLQENLQPNGRKGRGAGAGNPPPYKLQNRQRFPGSSKRSPLKQGLPGPKGELKRKNQKEVRSQNLTTNIFRGPMAPIWEMRVILRATPLMIPGHSSHQRPW